VLLALPRSFFFFLRSLEAKRSSSHAPFHLFAIARLAVADPFPLRSSLVPTFPLLTRSLSQRMSFPPHRILRRGFDRRSLDPLVPLPIRIVLFLRSVRILQYTFPSAELRSSLCLHPETVTVFFHHLRRRPPGNPSRPPGCQ